ncbi:MAG: transcription factor E [Thermoprotei archaeon]|nr:MAG: transcription factor E [Thermoprotei archaeon]
MNSLNVLISVISNELGEDAKKVFEALLDEQDEITDEQLAQKLNMKVNDVRRALYELSRLNLTIYRRVRDKTTNWYVYYWRINTEELPSIILQRKRSVLRKILNRLEYEQNNQFFICPFDGSRYTFDEAYENGFTCPRCGGELQALDNSQVIEILRRIAERLQEEINIEEHKLSSSS